MLGLGELQPNVDRQYLRSGIQISKTWNALFVMFTCLPAVFTCLVLHILLWASAVVKRHQQQIDSGAADRNTWIQASGNANLKTGGSVYIHFGAFLFAVYLIVLTSGLVDPEVNFDGFVQFQIVMPFLILVLLVPVNLLARGTIRAFGERLTQHVSEFQLRSICVLTLQVLLAWYVFFKAYAAPLFGYRDTKGIDSDDECLGLNATYLTTYCERRLDTVPRVLHALEAATGGQLVCDDGGYTPPDSRVQFRSLYDACGLLAVKDELTALIIPTMIASLSAMFLLLFDEFVKGIDSSVTRLTIFTDASWRLRIAAVIAVLLSLHMLLMILDVFTGSMCEATQCTLETGLLVGNNWYILPVVLWLIVVFPLLGFEFLVAAFKPSGAKVITPAQQKEVDAFEKIREAEKQAGMCTFWFIKADFVRNWKLGDDGPLVSLPRFQALRDKGCLEQREITLADACKDQMRRKYLAVSHRWLGQGRGSPPDESGLQLQKIQEYLNLPQNASIEYVWYDYWCMPQDPGRTPVEDAMFYWMLSSVNFVYLGCSVLVLLDMSYLSRFWVRHPALLWTEGEAVRGRPVATALAV